MAAAGAVADAAAPVLPYRVGHGFDLHRLAEGYKLIIGGVEIPHTKGCEAHSDGGHTVLCRLCRLWLRSRCDCQPPPQPAGRASVSLLKTQTCCLGMAAVTGKRLIAGCWCRREGG